MSELTIIQQTRLSTKERIRASELGYTTQDIEDLGLSKIRTLIKSGTVKTGKTDLQIQREEKLKLKNKNKYNKLLDKGKVLDAKWEKNVKIFNAQNDTNYTLDDFKKAKLINEGGYGRSSTFQIKGKNYRFGPSGALQFGSYLDHNIKISNFQNTQPLPDEENKGKKAIKPHTFEFTFPGNNKQIQENQKVNKIDETIKTQNSINNNRGLQIETSNNNKPPLTKELSIVK